MRIVMGADLHGSGRTPEDLEYSIQVFEDLYTLAVQQEAQAVFILGDLLHHKYGLELKLLLEWQSIIRYHEENHGITTVAIVGNHDLPWVDLPGHSAISLLPGKIYVEPTSIIVEGVLYCFLPWATEQEFIAGAKSLATQALQHDGLKFLFTHTSLAEGIISASNHSVGGPIRVHHLYPDSFDHIWAGDYHSHQTVGPKITYLGAPRPRTFGDWNNRGYWLLDVSWGKWSFVNLPLPSKYPEYIKLRIGPFGPPTIPDYDPKNNYIVECAMHWIPELGRKYRGIRIDKLPGESVIPQKMRISEADRKNPKAVAKRWRTGRGYSERLDPLMEEYIDLCLNQQY
jgi:DNA repair exonuclease SbcCD nuclease subunit